MTKISVGLIIAFLTQVAFAEEGILRAYPGARYSCPSAHTQELEVIDIKIDTRWHGIRYLCGVTASGYSWWDLISDKVENPVKLWFHCNYPDNTQKFEIGDLIKGVLDYTHTTSCERCNPGLRHECVPSFVPDTSS
jgi:hypothetical protein